MTFDYFLSYFIFTFFMTAICVIVFKGIFQIIRLDNDD